MKKTTTTKPIPRPRSVVAVIVLSGFLGGAQCAPEDVEGGSNVTQGLDIGTGSLTK